MIKSPKGYNLVRTLEFTVPKEFNNARLQKFLFSYANISTTLLKKLKLVHGGMTCNGLHIRSIDMICEGDKIVLSLPNNEVQTEASDIPLNIIYEDADIIVLNKPPYMPVHPSRGHQGDTLANAVAFHLSKSGIQDAFRAINRIDRNTSGLVVAAKNSYCAARLSGRVQKTYFAICEGILSGCFTVEAPIRIKKGHTIEREVGIGGQSAITHIEVLRRSEMHSFLNISLETGRTHQIRVHLSSIGHPLAGDDMYGGSKDVIARQALHCQKVWFIHPVTHTDLCFEAPLPGDMLI